MTVEDDDVMRESYGKALLLLTRLREEMWPGDHAALIDDFLKKLRAGNVALSGDTVASQGGPQTSCKCGLVLSVSYSCKFCDNDE